LKKLHAINAELAEHAQKLDVKVQKCGSGFLCLLGACLPSLTTLE